MTSQLLNRRSYLFHQLVLCTQPEQHHIPELYSTSADRSSLSIEPIDSTRSTEPSDVGLEFVVLAGALDVVVERSHL